MSNLELPPYIVNMSFVDAIRRDNVEYVKGVVRRTPCMATALFYTVDENSRALCLFDSILNNPTILLFTPIAYAMLFNSYRVLSFLLKHMRNPAEVLHISCYTADCLDPRGIWFHSYRLLEFPPFLVRRPNAELYVKIVDAAGGISGAGFNEPHQLGCSIYKRNKMVTKNTTILDNAWEVFWCIWSEFRNPVQMVDCSAELFIAGCDARKLAAKIDFEKLMLACQQNRGTATHIVYFLQLLLFHGADLTSHVVLGNYLNALQQMLYVKGCNTQAICGLFIAVLNLAGKKWLGFRHIVERLQADLRIDELPEENQNSLQMICVRRIREMMPGTGFLRYLWKMEELNEDAKRAVATGLIQHRLLDITEPNIASFKLRKVIRLGRVSQKPIEPERKLTIGIPKSEEAVAEEASGHKEVSAKADSRVQLRRPIMFKRDYSKLWRAADEGINGSDGITANVADATALPLELDESEKEDFECKYDTEKDELRL